MNDYQQDIEQVIEVFRRWSEGFIAAVAVLNDALADAFNEVLLNYPEFRHEIKRIQAQTPGNANHSLVDLQRKRREFRRRKGKL